MVNPLVLLQEFYPQVLAAQSAAAAGNASAYCSYSDVQLQLWTSSMFLGGKPCSLTPSCCARQSYYYHLLHPVGHGKQTAATGSSLGRHISHAVDVLSHLCAQELLLPSWSTSSLHLAAHSGASAAAASW